MYTLNEEGSFVLISFCLQSIGLRSGSRLDYEVDLTVALKSKFLVGY